MPINVFSARAVPIEERSDDAADRGIIAETHRADHQGQDEQIGVLILPDPMPQRIFFRLIHSFPPSARPARLPIVVHGVLVGFVTPNVYSAFAGTIKIEEFDSSCK